MNNEASCEISIKVGHKKIIAAHLKRKKHLNFKISQYRKVKNTIKKMLKVKLRRKINNRVQQARIVTLTSNFQQTFKEAKLTRI